MQQVQIPAGGTVLKVKGSFLRVESVVGATPGFDGVRVRANATDIGRLLPGEDVTLPQAVDTWEVIPEFATATAVVRIGSGRVRSNRVAGVLNTADSPAMLTLSQTQFLGWASKAPLAGQFAIAGMRAADAQATPTWVNSFRVWASATGSITVSTCTSDPGSDNAGTGPGFGANKRVGGSLSATRRLMGSATTATPSALELPGRLTLVFVPVQANVWSIFDLDTPILLQPGQGIAAVPNAADVTVGFIADFQERFIV